MQAAIHRHGWRSFSPVWFISGASSGIGRALAEAVLERGWRAVVTARQPDGLSDLARRYNERALPLPLDVTDPASIASAVEQARSRFGAIDVLVNSAGYGYLAARSSRPTCSASTH
ncbi:MULTISPECIES: SDR family NAD(P)-dependent oxidoreductase [Burkholderia]|uniref:SDR family NAD(P)-dependent oxidoreductase n=1 Tax=Burkholderia TaxID=32008 RepID=UPI0021BD28F4|nr:MULTISPECIES: SDR family NAD(P)-dependent oxidoreductase [Burkholderia]